MVQPFWNLIVAIYWCFAASAVVVFASLVNASVEIAWTNREEEILVIGILLWCVVSNTIFRGVHNKFLPRCFP